MASAPARPRHVFIRQILAFGTSQAPARRSHQSRLQVRRLAASIVRVVPGLAPRARADVHPLPAVVAPARVVIGARGQQSEPKPGSDRPAIAAMPPAMTVTPIRTAGPRGPPTNVGRATPPTDARTGPIGRRGSRARWHRRGSRGRSPHRGSRRRPYRRGTRLRGRRESRRQIRRRGTRRRVARTPPQSPRMTTAPLRRPTAGTFSWCPPCSQSHAGKLTN